MQNQLFMGQPVRWGTEENPPPHVRLWDILTTDQKKNVENWLPSMHQFRGEHLRGDARSWVQAMEPTGKIPDVTLKKRDSTDELRRYVGAKIVHALDGKMACVPLSSNSIPISGRYPPGTISKNEFAAKEVEASRALRDPPTHSDPVSEHVAPGFADYLDSIGEVVVRERNTAVWMSPSVTHQDQVIKEAWLASVGANNASPDAKASPLHEAMTRMYPREMKVWEKGLANEWLVTDNLRFMMATALQEVSSGSFSMREVGGHLTQAMRSCQDAMQQMVEASPAQSLVPVRTAVQDIWDELDQAIAALKKRPVPEPNVTEPLLGSFDAVNVTLQSLEKREALRQKPDVVKSVEAPGPQPSM